MQAAKSGRSGVRISACAYSQHGRRIQFGRSKQPGGIQLKARATAWLRDSVNPQGRLNRQAGRKRLTGRQKHPTRLA